MLLRCYNVCFNAEFCYCERGTSASEDDERQRQILNNSFNIEPETPILKQNLNIEAWIEK